MKIVIINGSPRLNGLTAGILHALERNLIAQGADVEFFNLSELSMSQCRGCCSCYTTGHCHMNDDAEKLSGVSFFAQSAGTKSIRCRACFTEWFSQLE